MNENINFNNVHQDHSYCIINNMNDKDSNESIPITDRSNSSYDELSIINYNAETKSTENREVNKIIIKIFMYFYIH